MAHDSFDEDIELANGHPVGSCRNSQNMAERTLLNTAKELEAAESEIRYYRETLERIVKISHNGTYGIGTLNDIEIVARSALQ